jgi:hypothetical protein
MLKIWEQVRHQVASRWVEGAVLVAVAVQAFGTGPGRPKPAGGERVTTVVTTRVVMAAPDLDVLRPLGGALDPSPLESFDLRTHPLHARPGAAAVQALRDAERAEHAAFRARRAVEREECEQARRQAAPRAPIAPRATPRPAPAAAPNLRGHTAV